MRRGPECVAVFGGAGNMGGLIVRLFRDLGHPVLVVDPKDPNSSTAADAIRSSGIIFFSVLPIGAIDGIILGHEGLFDEGHRVLDNATVKRPFREAYQRLLLRGVPICSTHPLCKHDQPLHGQKALVMPVGGNATEARRIGESIYGNAGMELVDFPFEQHDVTMLLVQAIPHFMSRLTGRLFESIGVDMRLLQRIAPANFQLFNLGLWRTLNQKPEISAMIVSNLVGTPEGQAILAQIAEAFRDITGQNQEELTAAFAETFLALGGENFGPEMNYRTTEVLEMLAHLPKSEREMAAATSIGKSG